MGSAPPGMPICSANLPKTQQRQSATPPSTVAPSAAGGVERIYGKSLIGSISRPESFFSRNGSFFYTKYAIKYKRVRGT